MWLERADMVQGKPGLRPVRLRIMEGGAESHKKTRTPQKSVVIDSLSIFNDMYMERNLRKLKKNKGHFQGKVTVTVNKKNNNEK